MVVATLRPGTYHEVERKKNIHAVGNCVGDNLAALVFRSNSSPAWCWRKMEDSNWCLNTSRTLHRPWIETLRLRMDWMMINDYLDHESELIIAGKLLVVNNEAFSPRCLVVPEVHHHWHHHPLLVSESTPSSYLTFVWTRSRPTLCSGIGTQP